MPRRFKLALDGRRNPWWPCREGCDPPNASFSCCRLIALTGYTHCSRRFSQNMNITLVLGGHRSPAIGPHTQGEPEKPSHAPVSGLLFRPRTLTGLWAPLCAMQTVYCAARLLS